MSNTNTKILIVGAGVSGIAVGTMLRKKGIDDFLIIDRGDDFGGTWRDNIYPGVECDVQSHLYSYSFRPNPAWSKAYAPGEEILDYLKTVADESGLGDNTILGQNVTNISWDSQTRTWIAATSERTFTCDYIVVATGTLTDARLPEVPGIDAFSGTIVHSAQWDPALDLTGRKVAVVGTGASAIQVVPAIAEEVEHLTVFQRTAPWIAPRFDTPYSEDQRRVWERLPETLDSYRQHLFWLQEARFPERVKIQESIERMTAIAVAHRENQLTDPELKESTRPNYAVGCKRILMSNKWYPALEKPNVSLVAHSVVSLTESGVVDAEGAHHDVDTVIFCSGFDTVARPAERMIHGPSGSRLSDVWAQADGARAYGGMAVAGYPNLFLVNGPNVGLGFGSMFFMIETQAEYVAQALATACKDDVKEIEVREDAQDSFADFVDSRAEKTVWLTGGCDSFYLADGSGRLTSLWPDFMSRYRSDFSDFDPADYTVRTAEVAAE